MEKSKEKGGEEERKWKTWELKMGMKRGKQNRRREEMARGRSDGERE